MKTFTSLTLAIASSVFLLSAPSANAGVECDAATLAKDRAQTEYSQSIGTQYENSNYLFFMAAVSNWTAKCIYVEEEK
jgi:hypothetical protein